MRNIAGTISLATETHQRDEEAVKYSMADSFVGSGSLDGIQRRKQPRHDTTRFNRTRLPEEFVLRCQSERELRFLALFVLLFLLMARDTVYVHGGSTKERYIRRFAQTRHLAETNAIKFVTNVLVRCFAKHRFPIRGEPVILARFRARS